MLAAATAVATAAMTKTLEKTGEKLGEQVFELSEQFIALIRGKPKVLSAIEKVPQQPLDYGYAVLEVKALAKSNPEVGYVIEALAAAAQEDPDPRLQDAIQKIVSTLSSQEPSVQNLGQLAERIGLVVQGGSVSIQNFKMGG